MLFFLYIYIIDRNGIKLPVKLIFRLINTQELVYLFDIGPLKMLRNLKSYSKVRGDD